MSPPPPPVPWRLREMLQGYPGHIERLQEVLSYMLEEPAPGVDPFERAIWLLEGRLETFIFEAREELKAAVTSGDEKAVELARAKESLMLRAHSKNGGLFDLSELQSYFGRPQARYEGSRSPTLDWILAVIVLASLLVGLREYNQYSQQQRAARLSAHLDAFLGPAESTSADGEWTEAAPEEEDLDP